MPAVYTHHVFTKDVYDRLSVTIKNRIKEDIDIFEIFGKSFDILFFSHSKLGHLAHNSKTNFYFENILTYISENKLQSDSKVLAYLYGSICHYVLDSVSHPYIFYKTGKFNYMDKNSLKYKGMHSYYEYMTDSILYFNLTGKMIYKSKVSKLTFPRFVGNKRLKKVINYSILKTFGYKFGYCKFRLGYINFRLVFKHIMMSKFGIKKKIYNLIDKFNLFRKIKISNLCYCIQKLDYEVLNNEKKDWYNPADNSLVYNYSFMELYEIAVEKAIKIIANVDEILKNNRSIKEALEIIGNNSYCSGIILDLRLKMKYFDY